MKDILIGSAFVDDSEIQKKWYNLQQAFLKETTSESFDHIVVLSHEIKDSNFAYNSSIIHPLNKFKELGGSLAHQQSINILIDFFKNNIENYKYFLILDCDAFPIRKNWLRIILDKMPHHEIATLIRPENLEQRLHSSVLFAKAEALKNLYIIADNIGYDISGEMERDLHPPYYQQRRNLTLSMVRSNKKEVHPIGCGVYFDMFYHHTNGSGCKYVEKSKRSWDHVIPPTENLFDFTDELMNDPNKFICELAGWNPSEYAKISWSSNK